MNCIATIGTARPLKWRNCLSVRLLLFVHRVQQPKKTTNQFERGLMTLLIFELLKA